MDLTAINEKIQHYEATLNTVLEAKDAISELEKNIEKSKSDYLLQRIHQSRVNPTQETPKLFVVKEPKFARTN